MADTNDKRALERLLDEIVDCAVSVGMSEAMKGFGAFTEIDSISMTAMRRSISQKRAQILGHFDATATPPADAALDEDAFIELVTDYAQSKVRAESCQYHYESKEYDKEASETLEQIRAALRARAVPQSAPAGFVEWLCQEMPPGTVISDPAWWAPKIHRSMLSASKDDGK